MKLLFLPYWTELALIVHGICLARWYYTFDMMDDCIFKFYRRKIVLNRYIIIIK